MNVKFNVLYLHHVGSFGGASRSMLEMIRAFPSQSISPYVVTKRGQFAEILKKEDIPVITSTGISQFDHHRYSYYRGMRWLILLREIYYLPMTFFSLWRARCRWKDIDIVHVNEISMLPSIIFAKYLFSRPVIVHARCLQVCDKSLRSRFFKILLQKFSFVVIAIDENVKSTLGAGYNVEVIHNGLSVPQNVKSIRPVESIFTVAMVGPLGRLKGCVEFVKAAAICKQRNLKIKFQFYGASLRDNDSLLGWIFGKMNLSQNIDGEIKDIIRQQSLHDMVEFCGFTMSLGEVYSNIDVVCFPSYLDAPGRPVFEAAFFGVPSIVAISEPRDDTFIDGVTGINVSAKDAVQLADAIEYMYTHESERLSMGERAQELAKKNFDAKLNAESVLSLYRSCVKADS